MGGVATDDVSSQNFALTRKLLLIDCWAQLSQNMLNQVIDQLPKRLMMVINVKGAHVEFRLD